MSVISTHKNMIKLYYSSESSVGKQTLAYLDTSVKELLSIDVLKTNVTGTQWKDLAQHLGVGIGDLIDKEHPAFTEEYDAKTDLDENGWINVLNQHPEVLVYPIVIIGKSYYQINNPSDIAHKLEPDSKGIDDKKHL